MSDKAIIVTDMPENCSKCKFMYEFYGVKKCQLLNVLKNGGKAIICVDKLNVARKENCPLVSAEEHDKKIRDKAIEEFMSRLKEKATKFWNIDYYGYVSESLIDEIAEQMRQGE